MCYACDGSVSNGAIVMSGLADEANLWDQIDREEREEQMTDTAYEGWFKITDQTRPSESNVECSCGVLVWDINAHVDFHRILGQVCEVERQA